MTLSGISVRSAVAIGLLLAVGSHAPAQTGTGGAAVGLSTLRGGWQQRVLGGGPQRGGLPAQNSAWTPVRGVSATFVPDAAADAIESPNGQMNTLPDGQMDLPADGQMDLPADGQIEMLPDGQMGMAPEGIKQAMPGAGPMLEGGPGTYAGCAGGFAGGPACTTCGDPCGSCYAGCGPCGYRTRPWLHHIGLSVGVQGFKGSVDQGRNGNFGFNESINWSAPLSQCSLTSYQVGVRAVHSDFEGSHVQHFSTGDREQVFLTAGLFRRAPCGGWQWGVAYDYFHDSFYYGSVDLGQIRTELSWSRGAPWDVGFWGAIGLTDDHGSTQPAVRLEPTDLYAFFYRQHILCGGQWRLWAGFTGEGDGLVGADVNVPLGQAWSLETNFNYLTPNSQSRLEGEMEESWGVAFSLVWYPGSDARCEMSTPYYPLFRVADNSVFMVDLH